MCDFFSFCQDVKGNIYHLYPELETVKSIGDGPERIRITSTQPPPWRDRDSHTTIQQLFGFNRWSAGDDEKLANWEYNPLVEGLRLDTSRSWFRNHREWYQNIAEDFISTLKLDTQDVLVWILSNSFRVNWYNGGRSIVPRLIQQAQQEPNLDRTLIYLVMLRFRPTSNVTQTIARHLAPQQIAEIICSPDWRKYSSYRGHSPVLENHNAALHLICWGLSPTERNRLILQGVYHGRKICAAIRFGAISRLGTAATRSLIRSRFELHDACYFGQFLSGKIRQAAHWFKCTPRRFTTEPTNGLGFPREWTEE